MIFLLQHLAIVINLKKSVLDPDEQIEFLSLINTEIMILALSEKQLKHESQLCQEISTQPKTSVLKNAHKVNWLTVINSPGHFTSTDLVLISSTGTNISSTEKRTLNCSNGKFSQGGTPLVDEKLEPLQ